MTTQRRRKTHFPHLVQVRMSDTQKAFVDSLAPDKANQAAQVRKVFNQLIRHCLYDGTAPTAFYNYLAAREPVYWEQVSATRAVPGAEFLPHPYNTHAHRPYPPLGDYPLDGNAPRQTAPHQATAQVYTQPIQQPAPQPQHTPPAQVAQPIQQQAQPGPQYLANPYAHLPNSQRPPKYQATRQTRHATPEELAAEGRRAMQHAALEAQGKAPDWEHAPWEEVIPDNQA